MPARHQAFSFRVEGFPEECRVKLLPERDAQEADPTSGAYPFDKVSVEFRYYWGRAGFEATAPDALGLFEVTFMPVAAE